MMKRPLSYFCLIGGAPGFIVQKQQPLGYLPAGVMSSPLSPVPNTREAICDRFFEGAQVCPVDLPTSPMGLHREWTIPISQLATPLSAMIPQVQPTFGQSVTLGNICSSLAQVCIDAIGSANDPQALCPQAATMCWNKAPNMNSFATCFSQQMTLQELIQNDCAGKNATDSCSVPTLMMDGDQMTVNATGVNGMCFETFTGSHLVCAADLIPNLSNPPASAGMGFGPVFIPRGLGCDHHIDLPILPTDSIAADYTGATINPTDSIATDYTAAGAGGAPGVGGAYRR